MFNLRIASLFFLIAIALFFAVPGFGFAATLYWVGGNGDNVGTNANDWNTTNPAACNDGGGNASAVPGTSDIAVFDADCDNNATIAANWSVAGINMNSGYTGTLTKSLNITLTVGTSDFIIAGGTFTSATDTSTDNTLIDVNGNFTMSGGAFTSTPAFMTVAKSFTTSGSPTFTHNSGIVNFDGTDTASSSIDASGITFNTVQINRTPSSGAAITLTIASGTTLPLGNSPTLTVNNPGGNGLYHLTNNGTITVGTGTATFNVDGMLTNNGTISGSVTTWTMNGSVTNNDTITLSSASTLDFSIYNSGGAGYVTDSTSSLTTAADPTFRVSGSLTLTSGTTFPSTVALLALDDAWSSSTSVDASGVTFTSATISRTVSASAQALVLTIASGTTLPLGNTPTVTLNNTSGSGGSTYSITNNGTITVGTGTATFNVDGTLTNNGTISGSITTLTMNGNITNNDTITLSSVSTLDFNTYNSGEGSYVTDSTSTLTTASSPTLNLNGSLTLTSGTTFPSTIGTFNIDGAYAGNTSIDASGITFTAVTISRSASGSALTLVLTIASGTTLPLGNTPTVTLNNTSGSGGSLYSMTNNGTITVGTGTATFNVDGTLTNNGTISGSITTWTMNGSVTNNDTITLASASTLNFSIYNNGAGSYITDSTSTLTTASSPTVNVGGSLTLTSGTTWPASVAITFDDTPTDVTITAPGITFASAVINKSGNSSGTVTFTIAADTTIPLGNSPTITLNDTSSTTVTHLTNNGTITVGTGTFTFTPDTASGVLTNNGTITTKTVTFSTTGTMSNATNSTVNFIGDGDGAADTYTITSFATSYYNLVVNSTDGTTDIFALGAAPTVSNSLTVTAGILSLAGNDLAPVAITVASGAILQLQGGETVSDPTLSSGSTVKYVGTSGPYTLKSWAYHHLAIDGAATTFNLPNTIDVNGNLTISAGTLDVTATPYNITLAGNFTNAGAFTARTGTVTLDGVNQTLSGTTTFYNLTKQEATDDATNKTLTFTSGETTTIGGALTLDGLDASDKLLIRASAASAATIDFTGSSTFAAGANFLDVEYNTVTDNSSGVSLPLAPTDSTDSGNTTGWFATGVTIGGTVYTDEGTTNIGANKTVAVSVNGAAAAGTDDTDASGVYSIPSITVSAGDVLTLYLSGETEKGVTVTVGTGSDLSNIHIFQNDLIVRQDNAGSLTNTNLDTADNVPATTDVTDIYSVSGGTVTVAAGKSLYIPASNTYAPGGNVSVGGNFTNNGTYTKGTETLTLTGTGTQTLKTNGSQLYALTINGSGSTYTPSDATTVSNNLIVTAGTLSMAGSAFTVTGTTSISGTISTATSATGTKTFTGAVTVASGGTLNMSGQNPVVVFSGGLTQSSANLANIGSGANTFVGNFAGAGTGGVTFGGALDILSGTTSNGYTGGTVTVTGTLTLTGNWAQANGSALSLGSTTPFAGAGTFSASTATNTVSYTGGAATIKDPDAGTSHAYSNLSLSGSGAKTMTSITTTNDFTMAGSATTSGNVLTTIGGNVSLSDTATMTLGANLAVTGNVTIGSGTTLDVTAAGCGLGVSCTLSVGGNWTNAGTFSAQTGTVTLTGTGSQTLTSGSSSFYALTQNGASGTYALQDALTATNALTLTQGTFDANNLNVTVATFSSSNANTRAITMGTGTWTLTSTATATVWDMTTSTNATVTPSSSTIKINGSTANVRTFAGGGKTYNNIWITNATTGGQVNFTGSNTFADFKQQDVTPQTLKFTAGTTTTVTTFTANGTASNLLTIGSITAASHALAKAGGGTISSDYLSISRSDASPSTTWYAGTTSTDGGNNTGWNFTNSYVFDQKHFRFYNDSAVPAGLNTANAYAAQDTNFDVGLSTTFRLRIETANTGPAAGSITRRLEFKEDSGSWTQITTSTNNVRLSNSSNFADGAATTSRLTAVGTFAAGEGKDTGSDTSPLSLTGAYYTEDEYALILQPGAAGHAYSFRITNAGTALDTYTVTPTINTPDSAAPTASGFNPATTSTIRTATPTITYNLSEDGDCKASTTNASYTAMSGADCTGDGSTSGSCLMPSLGSNGSYTIYFACRDIYGNEDTSGTTDSVSYTLNLSSSAASGLVIKGNLKFKGNVIVK